MNHAYAEISPSDQFIELNDLNNITWNVTEKNPDKYWISKSGILISGPDKYNSNEDITTNVDTSKLGQWIYTLYINDTSGIIYTDEVKVIIRDTKLPILSSPQNLVVESIEFNKNITWNVTEKNPGKYWVSKNGILLSGPSKYKNNTDINITVNTSELGMWIYTIYANDTSGNLSSDEVNVTIYDSTRPIINLPSDQSVEQGAPPTNFNCSIIEMNPYKYKVLIGGTENKSDTYQNNTVFPVWINTSMNVDSYNYTIIANDTSNNTASDKVNVTVMESEEPQIKSPDDQTVEQYSSEFINWTITEMSPNKYKVLINGTEYRNDSYRNNTVINVPIITSNVGNYNYTIIANDTLHNVSSDQVNVTIDSDDGDGDGASIDRSDDGRSYRGGGFHGEDRLNILLYEIDIKSVYANQTVIYYFDLEGNVIEKITFKALKNSGRIATKVEILKNTSSLVNSSAPGIVYKNVNIWVGDHEWIVFEDFIDAAVYFKIEKSWIEVNNIDEDTIQLYCYGSWIPLKTIKIDEDTGNSYFKADTLDLYSPFAIAGREKSIAPMVLGTNETIVKDNEEKKGIIYLIFNIGIGIGIVILMILLYMAYRYKMSHHVPHRGL